MVKFSAEEVGSIHEFLVGKFLDSGDPISPPGIKNSGMLESATARPFQSAGGREIYETCFDKAAALFHSLINNHPFHNGNKRTALISLCVFLDRYGYWLDDCSDDDLYEFTKRVAAHEISESKDREIEDISAWIAFNSRKRTKGEKPLKYHELKVILQRFGYEIDPPDKEFLYIHKDGEVVQRIIKQGIQGFRPYHTDYIAGLRKRLGLTPEFGIDSEAFYGRIAQNDDFSEIIELRSDVIRRLAKT
ncbi:type II toxin-antitoxin system death-on-curing family toxin [Desulfocurvus sp.]|uniref:type II toxin-antitoxin system death-on-curing family toxin n=1 Tax=Desulfocurvus sp. TaxID=2871698 RepID=UPI0025BCF302|nr:type II toxin-antitoxin system death-on-curing family toxin [Desulfocurvus sp.]MCK9240953.1 type II toxin-antitoxin system death-on-curing family toxin [Desulfocurvus sp.]